MEAARDTKKKRSLAVTSSASTAAGGSGGLTDDVVVDILARVPVKSICRFKCVSLSWRNLISHPDNRKKLPQTLTGFFYFEEFGSCTFVSLTKPPPPPPPRRTGGRGWQPPPSPCDFLPANVGGGVVDCCNGLVLLNNSRGGSGAGSDSDDSEPHTSSYVVCNPATEKWTTVPGSTTRDGKICSASILCFDPAVSAHFHVVELLDREADEDDWYSEAGLFEGFNIYSSETGAWVYHPHNSHWSPCSHRSRRTFFNGLLHFVGDDDRAVAALDMKGQTRSVIPVPRSGEVQLVGHSQGRLLYANRDARNTSKLSIHVLGENGKWTLKHCVDTSGMFSDADEYSQSGLLVGVAAVHPHGDSIFLFDSLQGRVMSYGMGSRRRHVIRSVEESPLWSFVPYVPLYLEMAALENSN